MTRQSTVARYLPRPRKPPSQTERTFLNNYLAETAAIEFFTVSTATFRILFVFVVLSHNRPCVLPFVANTIPPSLSPAPNSNRNTAKEAPNTEKGVFGNHDAEICRRSSESCMIPSHSTRFHFAGDIVRKTVLIVEDNESLRQALCELFRRQADFDVCGVAQNGREAIEVADRLHPDLIVLDLLMPEMNGLEAARALKRGLPTVPLIMYSAIDDSLSEEVRLIGISEVVSKSDPPSLLVKKARALVYRTAA
jgi:CheY-like chemotaxis protein